MKELPIKKYVRYLFGILMLIFLLNKFYLRPWVLNNKFPDIFPLIVLSIQNLLEAIVGTFILTGILFQLRQMFHKKIGKITNTYIHLIAVAIAAIYVISQKLKFHNLGGINIFDFFDIVASIIGLVTAFGLMQIFGFIEKPNAKILDS